MREIFGGLWGNSATKERVGSAIISHTVPHSFLIDGAVGSGKYTLATEIAAALNCDFKDSQDKPLPCRECESCKKILGEGHVDVHVLSREGGKATIGVEAVRDFRADMYLSATEAEYKIYIVKEAERLTVEAQNALLTVMEEPPKNVVIILLSAGTDKILTTIKSRAQYIAMSRFSCEEIATYIKENTPEARALSVSDAEGFATAIISADGCIGPAKELLTGTRREDIKIEREAALDVIRALGRGTPYDVLYSAVGALPQKRKEFEESLERVILAISDLVKLHYDENAALSFFTKRGEAEELLDKIGTAKLLRVHDAVLKIHEENTKNANITTLTSALTAKLWRA